MSLLGTLERLNLSLVLQRIERHAKTGLLQVKQDMQWVELYFQEGYLVCIGPVRANTTLSEKLRQDGIISTQVFQEIQLALGPMQFSEMRTALALLELGHVGHEELRGWFAKKAAEVLQIVLTWSVGEIYFEEGAAASSDRLLISVSISSLLSMIPALSAQPTQLLSSSASYNTRPPDIPQARQSGITDVSRIPTLTSPSQFMPTSPSTETALPLFSEASPQVFPSLRNESPAPPVSAPIRVSEPIQVPVPSTPRPIDTSFMRPDMILVAADLSALRESNPSKQLTPEQWRLLTRVDGRSSLLTACQELAMTPEQVCRVASELITEGLLHLSLPGPVQTNEFSPASRDTINTGLNRGYIPPGSAAATTPPWSAPSMSTGEIQQAQFGSSVRYETQSQWGNGGNGATFIPGRGWIANPQPLRPLPSNGPLASSSGVYDIYRIRGGE